MAYCDKCDKVFASRQLLWKYRQRKHGGKKENNVAHKEKFLADIKNNVTQRTSKDNATEDGLQETSGNGLIIRPRIGSAPVHKKKFIADIINNVTKRAKDQNSTSILPKERMNSVLPVVKPSGFVLVRVGRVGRGGCQLVRVDSRRFDLVRMVRSGFEWF